MDLVHEYHFITSYNGDSEIAGAPARLGRYGERAKTDSRDAHELALCLDRHLSGDTCASLCDFGGHAHPNPPGREGQNKRGRVTQGVGSMTRLCPWAIVSWSFQDFGCRWGVD
jgi:hypothetical protein